MDEDEPMLMPLGGGIEEETSAFSPSSSEPRSSDPSLQSSSSDGRGGRAETLGSPGTLVHQYLKQNSQVKAHIPSFSKKKVILANIFNQYNIFWRNNCFFYDDVDNDEDGRDHMN